MGACKSCSQVILVLINILFSVSILFIQYYIDWLIDWLMLNANFSSISAMIQIVFISLDEYYTIEYWNCADSGVYFGCFSADLSLFRDLYLYVKKRLKIPKG